MEQLKRWPDYMCMCTFYPAASSRILPADLKEQAGRTQRLHNHVRAPSLSSSLQFFEECSGGELCLHFSRTSRNLFYNISFLKLLVQV
jgi:hypothetical protein